MAIKALDIGKVHRFISKKDDPKDATVFLLGVLSSRDIGAVRDMATSFSMSQGDDTAADPEVSTTIERTKMNFEAVRRALRGWENFIGPDDKPITYKAITREQGGVKKDFVDPALLDLVPLDVINEMAEFVLAQASPTEADGKN